MDEAVREAVDVDMLGHEHEFARLPTLLATWNEKYARALGRHLAAKFNLKTVYARRSLHHRAELLDLEKKPTEKTIETMVEVDDLYLAAVLEHIEAETDKARVFGVVDSLRAKKEALVSIGAHARLEMGMQRNQGGRLEDDEDD